MGDSMWLRVSDASVVPRTDRDAQDGESTAYLLFYELASAARGAGKTTSSPDAATRGQQQRQQRQNGRHF